ncbi:MAG: hypothetical protein H6686_12345 [Fibrobacteria bacterium]|nr:hypothetical protein [Fibrobacteria bacterium]
MFPRHQKPAPKPASKASAGSFVIPILGLALVGFLAVSIARSIKVASPAPVSRIDAWMQRPSAASAWDGFRHMRTPSAEEFLGTVCRPLGEDSGLARVARPEDRVDSVLAILRPDATEPERIEGLEGRLGETYGVALKGRVSEGLTLGELLAIINGLAVKGASGSVTKSVKSGAGPSGPQGDFEALRRMDSLKAYVSRAEELDRRRRSDSLAVALRTKAILDSLRSLGVSIQNSELRGTRSSAP